jgi:hypothetical protein
MRIGVLVGDNCGGVMNGSALATKLTATIAVVLVLAASASAYDERVSLVSTPVNDFTIVVNQRAGPYRYLRALNHRQSYPQAIQSFGAPSGYGGGGNLCTVRWSKIGLNIHFATSDLKPCLSRSRGAWYGMTAYDPRWHTNKLLYVGDPETNIKLLYPRARMHGSSSGTRTWTLVTGPGDVGTVDWLQATVNGDIVTSINVPAGYIW